MSYVEHLFMCLLAISGLCELRIGEICAEFLFVWLFFL